MHEQVGISNVGRAPSTLIHIDFVRTERKKLSQKDLLFQNHTVMVL